MSYRENEDQLLPDVDLIAGGAPTLGVTSEAVPPVEQVRGAVDEAGYELAGATR